MASLSDIRAKVAEKLDAIDSELTAYAEPPGSVNPPAALILPGEPALLYGARMGDKPDLNLVILLLLEAGDSELGQVRLDPYLADSGTQSIRAAVNGTLDGLASMARVHTVQNYGRMSYESSSYLGAELLMSITAR